MQYMRRDTCRSHLARALGRLKPGLFLCINLSLWHINGERLGLRDLLKRGASMSAALEEMNGLAGHTAALASSSQKKDKSGALSLNSV